MQNYFNVEYTEEGCLKVLENAEDKFHMNWSRGKILWGSTKAPEGILVKKSACFYRKRRVKRKLFLSEYF